jgi:hypothetical protein
VHGRRFVGIFHNRQSTRRGASDLSIEPLRPQYANH